MPEQEPPRDERAPRAGGRPAGARRPADGGTRAMPVTGRGDVPAEQEPRPRPQARPAPAGWNSTTYGKPVRRRTDRPAGQEQRLAPPARPAGAAGATSGAAAGRARTAVPPGRGWEQPPPPPPPSGPRRGSAPRPAAASRPGGRVRRRRLLAAAVAVALVLAVLYPAALAWRGWSAVTPVAATSPGERPADTPGTTYLVVGSDSRDGMSEEEKAQYSAGGDDISGRRTDTIMLLHVPAGGGPAALISVPRDSWVPVPGHGSQKVNAAYSIGGAPLLAQTLEDVGGIRVDHYVETSFIGFARIVDAVGGVEMCPEVAVQDVRAGLDIQAGCQDMDGATALGYARYRYSDPLGDLGRANRQRDLLAAITARATSPGTLVNPFRTFPLASSAGSALTVDDGASPLELARFALGMRSATGADGISMTVPVADPNYRTSSGLAVKWDTERALAMFDALRRDDTGALRALA
ncbi:LCP family protein [Kineococcus terrestris]|uniref:LCP family protein n=1 Tax=Kineococcus terrestris TaxID=2044856 RepID=UPI0034DB1EA3